MIKTKHLFLIFLPAILVVILAFWIRVVQYRPLYPEDQPPASTIAPAPIFIPVFPDDPILGEKNAGKTIIAFEDLACPRCQEQIQIFHELIRDYPGRVKVIIKALPVTRFPLSSVQAHAYGYCAREQNGFLVFSEKAIAHEGPLDPAALQALARAVDLDEARLTACLQSGRWEAYQKKVEELAAALGVTALPAVFVDQKLIQEPATIAGWKELLGLE